MLYSERNEWPAPAKRRRKIFPWRDYLPMVGEGKETWKSLDGLSQREDCELGRVGFGFGGKLGEFRSNLSGRLVREKGLFVSS